MSDYGRETVAFFEIDVPFCSNTYGESAGSPTPATGCRAILGVDGERKCYNTRATCQDTDRYTAGTLTLRFAMKQQDLLQYGNVIPSMLGPVQTTPGSLNLGAMDRSSGALGQREVVTVSLEDHQHSDHLVDKYRLERRTGLASASGSPADAFDPYTRGTFWGKFKARNPYYSAYACRVREGFLGDDLDDMRVRHYILDRITGPKEGKVTLVAKDIFARIEARKAVAPSASEGELDAAISAVAAALTLAPVGIGELQYDASGYLAIGEEIVAYTRVGDVCTLTERGALGTDAEEHEEEDLVQQVLSYSSETVSDLIYDLMLRAGYTAAQLPKSTWDALTADLQELYSAHIAVPTPINEMVGELCEQAGITVYPNVETGQVDLSVLRAAAGSVTITDNEWIIDGTLSVKQQTERRISQVWVYYAQVNPLLSLSERKNYRSRIVVGDSEAESEEQYNSPAIREIFSRWIPQNARTFAQDCGERILAIFRDPPYEASFSVHASRAESLGLAQAINIEVQEIQDDTGSVLTVAQRVIELERTEHEIGVRAQQVSYAQSLISDGEITIYLENDDFEQNMLSIFEGLFGTSDGNNTVTFIVESGTIIGSTTTGAPALRTGIWPGDTLFLENRGRIQGKGGEGGDGSTPPPEANGWPGENGGPALLVEYPITIDNTNGEIWAGGGGGGGGATAAFVITQGGGGGGGGAGTEGGTGGEGNPGVSTNGDSGTSESGGAGGVNFRLTTGIDLNGGAGGGPGLPGEDGETYTTHLGGAGAAAGNYIVGNSNVTWVAVGDVRGGVS